MLDVNSLYATVIAGKMPYGELIELDDDEILKFEKEFKDIGSNLGSWDWESAALPVCYAGLL